MAVVALASVTGAPGVTTTAVALALAWSRPCLLVEADVAGGSSIIAGYLRGGVPHDRGLVDLAVAHRNGRLAESLHQATIPLGQSPTSRLLPGLTSPAQISTVQALWEPLAVALQGLETFGVDVIIDAGRLGAAGGPAPLLREADQLLVVTGTQLPGIAALPGRIRLLREDLQTTGTRQDALGLLVVGDHRPYSSGELSKLTETPVVATIAWEPAHAASFSTGKPGSRRSLGVLPPPAVERTSIGRSIRNAVSRIQTRTRQQRQTLAPVSHGVGEEAPGAENLEPQASHG